MRRFPSSARLPLSNSSTRRATAAAAAPLRFHRLSALPRPSSSSTSTFNFPTASLSTSTSTPSSLISSSSSSSSLSSSTVPPLHRSSLRRAPLSQASKRYCSYRRMCGARRGEVTGSTNVPGGREVLPTNVKPLHYDLTLEPNFANFSYDGTVVIEYVTCSTYPPMLITWYPAVWCTS